jgi:hypothetical protein
MAQGSMEIARMGQQTAQQQLAWAKEQDAMNRGTLNQVLGVQLPIMQENYENAKKDRSRYETMFQPLENNLVQEFQNYDSPERRAQERGRSIADVNKSFDATRRNALQRLESYGVDPSQTRNAALDLGTRVQQAAAQAGAATAADRATEQTGRALRAEAINIGKGMPSNVAASYGQSLQAGNSGIGNANATTGAASNAYGGANQFMNTGISGYGQAGNTASQGYANQMQQYNANQANTTGALGAVGNLAGMAMIADGGPPRELFDSEPGEIDYGNGDGSGIDDQVPIMASKEEYIIPADVVRAKGVEFFDKLVERYHTPAEQQREDEHTQNVRNGKAMNPKPSANGGTPRYAMGGAVGMAAPPQTMQAMPQPIRPQQPAAPSGGLAGGGFGAPPPGQARNLFGGGGAPMGGQMFSPPRQQMPPLQPGMGAQAQVMPGGQNFGGALGMLGGSVGMAPPQQAMPARPTGGFGGGGFAAAPPGGARGAKNTAPAQGPMQRPGMPQMIGRAVQQARPGMAPPRAQAQMPRRAIS